MRLVFLILAAASSFPIHPAASAPSASPPNRPPHTRSLLPDAGDSARASQPPALAVLDSLWRKGPVDSFWTRLDREVETARAARDSSTFLTLIAMRGQARARFSLAAEAEPDLRLASRLAARRGAGAIERRSLRWLAYALQREGRDPEAVACYRRLLDLARESGDMDHEAWALSGLAYSDWRAGRSAQAQSGYASARSLFQEEGDPGGKAFATNGLGTAMQALGRYDEAISLYEEAASLAEAQKWDWLRGVAMNNTAVVLYFLGDPGEARSRFMQALDLQRRSGDLGEAALMAVNVSNCDIALGRFEDAAAEITRSWEECRQHGVVEILGHLRNAMADIRREQGRLHSAAALYREGLARNAPVSAQDRIDALVGLSRALVVLDSLPAATRLIENEAPWISRIGDRSMRLQYEIELGRRLLESSRHEDALAHLGPAEREAERLGLGEFRIQALSAAASAARDSGDPDRAIAYAREAVRVWETDRGLPLDPEWREIRGATIGEVSVLFGSLLLDHPAGLTPERRARASFDSLQVFKARTLMERMRGPSADSLAPLEPATAADLQRWVLRPGELFLDYYLGKKESLVFALTLSECRAARLPPAAELEGALGPYLEVLATPPSTPESAPAPSSPGSLPAPSSRDGSSPSPLDASRKEMIGLLLEPVRDMLPACRSLIVAPDGILHRVSFADLLAGDPGPAGGSRPEAPVASPASGAATAGAAMPPEIQIVPSATILELIRRREAHGGSVHVPQARRQTRSFRVLALSGHAPDLPGTGSTDASGVRSDAPDARLEGAREEVGDIDRRYRHVTTSPPDRGAGADLSFLRGYSLLHFAGHATIDEQYPWRSRIDPALTASDISRARLDARLAVLSTCRSAGGRVLSGEGVQSLAGSFLVAGVPTVVASLWRVDDTTTRSMMRFFYSALAGGATVSGAVRSAQLTLRDSRQTRDPLYWAGFVVVGDGSPRVPLERRPFPIDPARVLILLGVLTLLGWGAARAALPRNVDRGRL